MEKKYFDPFTVEQNKKVFNYLNVVRYLTNIVNIPVGVIQGSMEGPTLTVTAGLFGHEYCGIEAASRLYQMIQPHELSGRLIVIPVVDMPCFQFRTPWFNLARSLNPIDGIILNTLFPGELPNSEHEEVAYRQESIAAGDPSGLVTKHIASILFHEIISKSDYHIDLRGGDLDESHMAHTIFLKIGRSINDKNEKMAKIAGLEYVFPSTSEIGHTTEGTLIYESVKRDIPSIIIESGIGCRTQPLKGFINLHIEGVLNILKYFGMLPGNPLRPKAQRYLDTIWHWITVPSAGIFHAFADQGDLIKRGEILGRVTDIDGSELCKITSPIDGIVHCMFPRRVVFPGDDVYALLKLSGLTGW